MERLAIINHDEHVLIIDDVTEETLEKYNNEEEEYIRMKYGISNYSWEYVTSVLYWNDKKETPKKIEVNI